MDKMTMDSDAEKNSLKTKQFKIVYVLIPALVALFILSYEDFINGIIIQPFIYVLATFAKITIPTSGNTYVLYVLLLNLILNFAALTLIYFFFFRSKLLHKQIANKQYGLFTTIKTFLALYPLVYGLALVFSLIQTSYFPDVSTSNPYQSIFPSTPDYSMLNLFLVIILVCFFAPILEELIFRRILIPLLEGTGVVSTPFAIVISASVFAFIHSESDLLDGSIYFAIVHFTAAFTLGLGLAGVFVVTRNVKYNIFFHGLNNALSLIPQILVAYLAVDLNNPNSVPPILVAYSLGFLLLILVGFVFLIIALVNFKKVKFPLVNQFKYRLATIKYILTIISILIVQGIIFIVIPYLEGELFKNFTFPYLERVIINAVMYVVIFLFFIFVIKKNFNTIKESASVSNPEIPPEPNQYYFYPGNQPYNYNVGNPYNQQPYNPNINTQYSGNTQTNAASLNCPNCGKNLPKDALNFCPFCGSKLN